MSGVYNITNLNALIKKSLSGHMLECGNETQRPFEIVCKYNNMTFKLRIYAFRAVNPPGGRTSQEYKINLSLSGQKGGSLDSSKGYFPLLIGYVPEYDEFILWDAFKHIDFSLNANVQIHNDTLLSAMEKKKAYQIKESSKTCGYEIAIACDFNTLMTCIAERYNMRINELVGEIVTFDGFEQVVKNEPKYYIWCLMKKEPLFTGEDLAHITNLPLTDVQKFISSLKTQKMIKDPQSLSEADLSKYAEEIARKYNKNPNITINDLCHSVKISPETFMYHWHALIRTNEKISR